MKNIRSFNENWTDKLNIKKTLNDDFLKKRTNYLTQFSPKEKTVAEKLLIECLYHCEFLKTQQEIRILGIAEGVLTTEGFFKMSQTFQYKQKEDKFLFMKFKREEDYKEMIIRSIKEYLTEKRIL